MRAARWGKRPSVSVAVVFPGAGSVADPEGEEGLIELTADSFLGGTRSRDTHQLAEALDDLAAHVDISAGFDSATARLSVLEREVEGGLALLAEILREPAFPEDEVGKTRRRHVDSLAEQRTEPDFLARERLLAQLYPGHPYGRLAPSARSLSGLTSRQVTAIHRQVLDLGRATVILVGPGDPERLLELGCRLFPPRRAELETPPAVPTPSPLPDGLSVHVVDRPGSVQTNVHFARRGVKRSDPRYPAAVLANQSLGGGAASRLFRVLREERGLTYGAFSSVTPHLAGGHFSASMACRNEVTREAVTGLLDLIGRFVGEGPTEDEHRRSKNYLHGTFALARETPSALATDEASRVLFGLPEDEWATWRDRLEAVSTAEAAEVARTLFFPGTGVLTAVGEAATLGNALEELGTVTVWDAGGNRLR